ncbi:mucin-4-like [Littorina saxatilis]|uniref:C-type lectin domain-containing protein n=1 Tax=Littorina saxatilis TaxID=31220 RepID=A0AAN9B5D6_9CAEN
MAAAYCFLLLATILGVTGQSPALHWTIYPEVNGNGCLTWNEASRFCAERGGHLPTLNSDLPLKGIYEFVKKWDNKGVLNTEFWTGLYSQHPGSTPGQWEGDCTQTAVQTSYAWRTSSNEPDNLDAELCVRMNREGTWQTKQCDADYAVVCQFDLERCWNEHVENKGLAWSQTWGAVIANSREACWEKCLTEPTIGIECMAAVWATDTGVCMLVKTEDFLKESDFQNKNNHHVMLKRCFTSGIDSSITQYDFENDNSDPQPACPCGSDPPPYPDLGCSQPTTTQPPQASTTLDITSEATESLTTVTTQHPTTFAKDSVSTDSVAKDSVSSTDSLTQDPKAVATTSLTTMVTFSLTSDVRRPASPVVTQDASGDTSPATRLSGSRSTDDVDTPTAPDTGVQSTDTAPDTGVQSTDTAPDTGVQSTDTAPDTGVQSTDTAPDTGVQSTDTAPDTGVQSTDTAPDTGVQSTDTAPDTGVQSTDTAPDTGVQSTDTAGTRPEDTTLPMLGGPSPHNNTDTGRRLLCPCAKTACRRKTTTTPRPSGDLDPDLIPRKSTRLYRDSVSTVWDRQPAGNVVMAVAVISVTSGLFFLFIVCDLDRLKRCFGDKKERERERGETEG